MHGKPSSYAPYGPYNGYKNWHTWNLVLWLLNDESYYFAIQDWLEVEKSRRNYSAMVRFLTEERELPKTNPDGVSFTNNLVNRKEVMDAVLEGT